MTFAALDALGCAAALVALVLLLRARGGALSRDVLIAAYVLVGLKCFLDAGNSVEWSSTGSPGFILALDAAGDYVRILVPVFFFVVFYIALRDVAQQELRRTAEELRASRAELKKYSEGLETLVDRRTREVQARNESLEETLDNLRATHAKLVQSEQLAMLGRFAASLAHEINSPLGAIQTAEQMLSTAIRDFVDTAPSSDVFADGEKYARMLELMRVVRACDAQAPSSREQREIRRAMLQELEDAGIAEPEEVAVALLKITGGAAMDLAPWLAFLRCPEAKPILQWVGQLADFRRSASIVHLAVGQASKVSFALRSYSHQRPDAATASVNLIFSLENVLTLCHGRLRNRIEVQRRFGEVPSIEGRSNELVQVWTNLIHNAEQAMPDGGTLTVSLRRDGEEHVEVAIADTGAGIPESIRERIFEPFFTTKGVGEGCGLGLDIVRDIVHGHHGEIRVDSAEGKGTTFTVRLPVKQPAGDE